MSIVGTIKDAVLGETVECGAMVEVLREGPQIRDSVGVLLQLDSAQDETHELTAEVSKHPVEEGADIADNIRVALPRVTINGIITATPLDDPFDTNREKDAWDTLIDIMNAREPVTVRTGLKTYPDMVLTSATITRDSKRKITPPLVFEQIKRVAPAWAILPAEAAKARPAAKPKDEKGTQAAKEADEKKKKSLALRAAETVFGDEVLQ